MLKKTEFLNSLCSNIPLPIWWRQKLCLMQNTTDKKLKTNIYNECLGYLKSIGESDRISFLNNIYDGVFQATYFDRDQAFEEELEKKSTRKRKCNLAQSLNSTKL